MKTKVKKGDQPKRQDSDSLPDFGRILERKAEPGPDKARMQRLNDGVIFLCEHREQVETALKKFFIDTDFYQNGMPVKGNQIAVGVALTVYAKNQAPLVYMYGSVGWAHLRFASQSNFFLQNMPIYQSATAGFVYVNLPGAYLTHGQSYVVRLVGHNPQEPVVDSPFSCP